MQKHSKVLLVIYCEGVLERPVLDDVRNRGAQGWSVVEVRGAGRDGVREGSWEADRTVRVEVICTADVADAIASHVLAVYAPHYAVALYFSEVQVLRPERF